MTISIKRLISVFLLAGALLFSGLAFSATSASAAGDVELNKKVCGGVNQLSLTSTEAECNDTEAETKINNILTYVINTFSIIVGIIAVVMIVAGGLKYITSGGDSAKVTSAKNSIIYAIIGLIIVALAQIIVRFVLTKATTAS